MNTNFYTQTIGGQKADVYRICQVYNITNPCIQHALKKLLRCGRSHKSEEQDIQDAIDTLLRWQEMQEENALQEMSVNQAARDKLARCQ